MNTTSRVAPICNLDVKKFLADLHIHTALSPCAEEEMTPAAIVRQAIRKGLAMIAICDHNTAGNTIAVREAAGTDITVIAGIEITTFEEVHVIGFFPNFRIAYEVGEKLSVTLPELRDTSRGFGEQLFMNAQGQTLRHETKMLSAPSTLTLSESVNLIRQYNGLAIAAHLDRRSFSVISQLGMLPEDIRFDAIELSAAAVRSSRVPEFTSFGLPVITSSDSHFLSEIGICRTVFEIVEPTFCEMALAFKAIGGRRCYVA
jgi:predicted metal-dependent phosphoesterase TrpH